MLAYFGLWAKCTLSSDWKCSMCISGYVIKDCVSVYVIRDAWFWIFIVVFHFWGTRLYTCVMSFKFMAMVSMQSCDAQIYKPQLSSPMCKGQIPPSNCLVNPKNHNCQVLCASPMCKRQIPPSNCLVNPKGHNVADITIYRLHDFGTFCRL